MKWESFVTCRRVVVLSAFLLSPSVARSEKHLTVPITRRGEPVPGLALGFTKNNEYVIFSTDAGATLVFGVRDGKEVANFPIQAYQFGSTDDGVTTLMAAKDKLFLMKRGASKVAEVKPQPRTPVVGYVGIRVQSKDGKTLIASVTPESPAERDGHLKVGDEILAVRRQPEDELQPVAGRSVNEVAAAISGAANTRVELKVIRSGENEPVNVILNRASEPISLIYSVNKGQFDILDVSNTQIVSSIKTQQLRKLSSAALSPNGRRFCLVGSTQRHDIEAEIFDVASGRVEQLVPIIEAECLASRFTADAKKLLSLSRTRVALVDLETKQLVGAFNHEGEVDTRANPAYYSVGGHLFHREFNIQAFGGGLRWRQMKVNDANPEDHGRLLARIRSLNRVAVSPQGLLAVGTDKEEVHVLDLQTGTHLMQYGSEGTKVVELLEFSPDGRWLAYFANGTLHIIDVADKMTDIKRDGKLDDLVFREASTDFKLTSANGGFEATFPTKPEFDLRSHRYHSKASNNGATFEVVWTEYGEKAAQQFANAERLREIYDTACQSLAKNTNGKITQTTDTTVNDRPERQLEWTLRRDGAEWLGKCRLAAHGRRLYFVTVTYPQEKPLGGSLIDDFLASFSLRGVAGK